MSIPSIVYHSVEPQNLKAAYQQYDNVDFILSFEGRSLEMGSVRIEGEWEVTTDANQQLPFGSRRTNNTNEVILYDRFVGAHSLLESMSVSIGGTQVDHLQDYARWIKMKTTATMSQSDMFNAEQACEMKVPSAELGRELLMGDVPANDPGNNGGGQTLYDVMRQNPDFSFKPHCVLNNASGLLPFRKSGEVRLTINLARVGAVLYGYDVNANVNYSVKNLRVFFRSAADAGPQFDKPILASRVLSVKQNFDTTNASLQVRVPAVCNSVSVSALETDKLNTLTANTLDLDKIDEVTQVEYLFNDATNQLITYRLRSQPEWIERYLDSLADDTTKENAATLSNLASNVAWGLGLDFGGAIDMRNSNFALQINRNDTTPYTMYFYFSSFITL